MKHPLPRKLRNLLTSSALPPVVIGVFLLLYIAIAFRIEDALMTLINLTSDNILLIFLFALIPLNRLLCLIKEIINHVARRRLMHGHGEVIRSELFDETVIMHGNKYACEVAEHRLADSGYTTRAGADSSAAWRGISAFPARVLFLAAMVCIFSGILLSLGGRVSHRTTVIEGEPIPDPEGGTPGGVVERIALETSAGPLLGKTLKIEVAPTRTGESKKNFGLYPPSRYRGVFVYPRYIGLGLYYRLQAPDIPGVYEFRPVLNIHPPGKEDSRVVEGTPYRIVFSMEQPVDGSDPYTTGQVTVKFKLLKGGALVFSGSVPAGGRFEKDGYRLEIPEIRRALITDYISDAGVYLIWLSALMLSLSFCIWLVVRTFFPLREMLFISSGDEISALSRTEGRWRNHEGLFQELLDGMGRTDG